MIRVQRIPDLEKILSGFGQKGLKTGFVPTMGALHPGHISLIHKAKAENDRVICSIFVNPTQFNDPKDLQRYPRQPEQDFRLLNEAGCDVLFTPEIKDMYPQGTAFPVQLDLGSLALVMEGKSRPGHFDGVVQIVSLLLKAVHPQKAYFGQKDFQQVAIVRRMVELLHIPVEIIACPIIREADGLAMSSRNALLNTEERAKAPAIFKLLSRIKALSGTTSVEDLIVLAKNEIGQTAGMKLDYFEIADVQTLLPVQKLSSEGKAVACIAVQLGNIRLIDNILL